MHPLFISHRPIVAIVVASTLCNVTSEFCPKLYHKGVLELDINPAFLNKDKYNADDGNKQEGLTISSFFHHTFSYNPGTGTYVPDYPPFAPDQVGRIRKILDIDPDDFDFKTDYEKLTGPKTTWPNDARRIPEGMLPFEGVIIPQGFFPIPTAGRLTIINLDDPDLTEYIVHEDSIDLDPPVLEGPNDMPKFYHKVLFHDMDGDERLDIVTVRSGYKFLSGESGPPTVYPPLSELVYYKNPGEDIKPNVQWEEVILYGGPLAEPPFMGPDIHLAMHDFDGDGNPEIVATHFFTGDNPDLPQPTKGKIAIYGAPLGGRWSDVNGTDASAQPRMNVIDDTQGFPFSVEIIDLNGDGTMEILATNHQPNCMPFSSIPGRVYALEQPTSGDIFGEKWSVRVLLDDILPQPTPAGARGMRLAPGYAISFFPEDKDEENRERPWILVTGDEAGRVWMMKPQGGAFDYESAVVFDINDYYGEHTTQTYTSDGFTISTIGEPAIFYEIDTKGKNAKVSESMSKETKHGSSSKSSKTKHGLKGSETKHQSLSKSAKTMSKSSNMTRMSKCSKTKHAKSKGSKRELKVHGFLRHRQSEELRVAKIYIPVFEAKEIHILSFDGEEEERIGCPTDVTYDCAAASV